VRKRICATFVRVRRSKVRYIALRVSLLFRSKAYYTALRSTITPLE